MTILPFKQRHPVLADRLSGGKCAVHWYVAKDGTCAGKDFYDAERKSRTSLMAQARVMAMQGGIRHAGGHWCDPPFEHVFAFTPSKRYRYFAFKHEGTYYITNGAMKTTTEHRQDADRRYCEKCRVEYLTNGR